MQRYSIHKIGKEYVVRVDGKDVLICKSRRDAERMIGEANYLMEESGTTTKPIN
jgi:hypothetical protein